MFSACSLARILSARMLDARESWPGGLDGAAGTWPAFPMLPILVIAPLRAPKDRINSSRFILYYIG